MWSNLVNQYQNISEMKKNVTIGHLMFLFIKEFAMRGSRIFFRGGGTIDLVWRGFQNEIWESAFKF